MKKGDWIILILAALLALLPLTLLLPQAPGGVVLLRQNGRVLRRLPLHTDIVLPLESLAGHNCIEIHNGQVRISSADCPDQTCVDMGPISRTGETLVCLPHRLTVTIEGAAGDAEPDAITR